MAIENSFITYYLHYRAYQTNRSGSRGIFLASIIIRHSSRVMQIYPLRIDVDLAICSRVPRIFLADREFFSSVENIFTGREIFGSSRIFWLVENVFFFFEII